MTSASVHQRPPWPAQRTSEQPRAWRPALVSSRLGVLQLCRRPSDRPTFRENHPLRPSAPRTSLRSAISRRIDHHVQDSSLHHRNCEACNAFASTDRTEPFGSIPFHRHRCTNCTGETLRHLVTSRRQLRAFTDHCCVDIPRFETRSTNEPSHLGEQTDAVSTGPLRIGIGEMLTDIAEPSGSEQCIGAGMSDDISIAVTHQSALALEHHSTQNQFSFRILGERVNVETLSDSYRHDVNLPEGLEEDGSDGEVVRAGDLDVGRFTVDHHDRSADRFDESCVVGRPCRRRVSGTKNVCSERLRGLDGDQGRPIGRLDGDGSTLVIMCGSLDGVGHRNRRDRRIGTGVDSSDDRLMQFGRSQRSSGIVDDDDRSILIDDSERRTHGISTLRSSGHRDIGGTRLHQRIPFLLLSGSEDDDDVISSGATHREGVIDDSITTEEFVLLRRTTETATGASSEHDRPDRSVTRWYFLVCHRIDRFATIRPRLGEVTECVPWERDRRHTSYRAARVVAVTDRELLSTIEFFKGFDGAPLDAVVAAAQQHSFARGGVLFTENDAATELFVVVSGRIAIANRSIDGRESVVALMERGDLLGEMPLFDGLARSAEARALEPSEVIAIPYAPLREIYSAQPQLLWNVVEMLANRLRNTDEQLADSVFLDVTGRTAKRLLELASGADEFSLPITQEELAGMVGASRERVNKAIASFVRLGWIEQSERRYRITNRDQLELRAR